MKSANKVIHANTCQNWQRKLLMVLQFLVLSFENPWKKNIVEMYIYSP